MKDAFLTFLIVSVAYIVTFSLTFGFVFPLQQLLLSGISSQVGLLFLPHGVRVLTLYFYGWRGMFYLLPVSYLMILLSVEQTGQDLLAPVVSLVCCYFGIQAIRLVFSDTIPSLSHLGLYSLYNNSCSAAYPPKSVCYSCRMECECLRFTSMDGEGCSIFYRRAT